MTALNETAVRLGVDARTPALAMSGLALTVIPEVRISDLVGLMDVRTLVLLGKTLGYGLSVALLALAVGLVMWVSRNVAASLRALAVEAAAEFHALASFHDTLGQDVAIF